MRSQDEAEDLMTFGSHIKNIKPNIHGNRVHDEIILSKSAVELLTSVGGRKYLEPQFTKSGVHGDVGFFVEKNDETKLVVHASDQINLDKAKDLIKELVTPEDIVSLDEQQRSLLDSGDLILFEIKDKFHLIHIQHEGNKIYFAGIKEQVDQAKDTMTAHFQENIVKQRKTIGAGLKKDVELLIRFKQDEFRKIEDSLKTDSVKIGLHEKYCKITIAGTEKGADRACKELMKLIEEIKKNTFELKKSETKRLLNKMKQLENDSRCIIDLEDMQCTASKLPDNSSKTQQGIKILIVKDDIAKEKVDAIVNSVSLDFDLSKNASAKALSDAAGPELQQELKQKGQNMTAGRDIVVTSGYKLECQKVFHVSLYKVKTKREEVTQVLGPLVFKCLEEADKRQFSSIAFPAIGTGNLGYPKDVVAKIFFEEVDNFRKKNPKTSILEVHFTLFHGDQQTIKAFEKQEANFIKSCQKNVPGRVDKSIIPHILIGDIAKEKADAIVNTVNADYDLSKNPCAKALSNAAGKGLQEECKKLKYEPGQIRVTGGYKLYCKNVFHAVVGGKDEKVLQSLVTSCLREASDRGFSSIAFPAIGTGNLGIPQDAVARIFFETVQSFQNRNPEASLIDVRFVLFHKDSPTIEAFKNENQKRGGQPVQPKKESIAARRAKLLWSIIKRKLGKGLSKSTTADSTDSMTKQNGDDKVLITITACSNGDLKQAETAIKGILEEYFEKVMDDDIIRSLSKSQENNILSLQKEYSVEIDIDVHAARVVIRGAENDVLKASLAVSPILFKLAEEKRKYFIELPEHWLPQPIDANKKEKEYHLQTLDPVKDKNEYDGVLKEIHKTAPDIRIDKIKRMQNPNLYRLYMVKKRSMEEKNRSNEMKLFHGTSMKTTNFINHKGFNRRYHGKNASRFGKGVYFARDASFSMDTRYSRPDALGNRCMYLAKVLVGEYAVGTEEMIEPPPKDPKKPEITYDTTVDRPRKPQVFVVYHDDQAYPEYLIIFKGMYYYGD